MGDILTGTPPELTFLNPLVREAWSVMWTVASGALVVILAWLGITLIVSEHLGMSSTGWREMVPRVLLGLAAAASSLWWCALVIATAGAISAYIASALGVNPGALLRAPMEPLLTAIQAGSVGLALFIAIIYLIYGFFVLYLLLQMVLRLALIDLLIVLGPVALGLWILPHTSDWGRRWLRLFMVTVFQQSVQLIALALAFGFLDDFARVAAFEPAADLVWKLLMSVAFVYLATRVPSMMGSGGTFDAWIHTLYFGLSLPGTMMRSARSMAFMAAGVASGAGAVVVGARAGEAAANLGSMVPPTSGAGSDGASVGAGPIAPRSSSE